MKQKNFRKLSIALAAGCAALKMLAADQTKLAASEASTNSVSLDALVAEALEQNPEANFYKE